MTSLISSELSRSEPETILWAADEHPITADDLHSIKDAGINFISNRIDPFRLAQDMGFAAKFSDFAFDSIERGQIRHVFFRIAKERALVHRVINQAFERLPTGGTLWLVGFKNEGIKTHISKASELFGSKATISKGKNQVSVASIVKVANEGQPLEDADYGQLRKNHFINTQNPAVTQEFWTKPGLYGWDKIDSGSQFLVEIMTRHFSEKTQHLKGKKALDLGCGYGYLSCFLAELNPEKIVATDNCIAALRATEKNLQELACPDYQVVGSNAGDSLCADGAVHADGSVSSDRATKEKFELITCNPPFHQGFATSDQLHKRFLDNTKRLLAPDGQAWYVVNQFLPLEKHCKRASLQYTEIARNNSFKVLLINH